MPFHRYWILTARKLNGEATPEELAELAELSAQHDDEGRTGEALERLWQQAPPGLPLGEEQRMLDLLHRRLPELEKSIPQKKAALLRRWRRPLAIAAGILVLLSVAGFFLLRNQRKTAVHEVLANRGTRSQLTLPDGTLVWLNAGSKLVYDDNYGLHKRRLQLEGEAYFDVAQQAGVPFEVAVKDAVVLVLGTAFNLRAYADESVVETSLISGSVQMQYHQADALHQALLKPGQKIILTRHTSAAGIATVQWESLFNNNKQAVAEIAWKDNTLSFDRESFSSLATRLERWYNITVVFESPQLKTLTFTGSIKGEQINEVMTVLSRSSGQFTYHYDQVTRVLKVSSK